MIVVFLETFLEIICVFHRVATFFKPQPCRNQLPEFGVTLLMQEVNFLETTSISSACRVLYSHTLGTDLAAASLSHQKKKQLSRIFTS